MPTFVRALMIALVAGLPLACSAAEAPKYQLGKDYLNVRQPQAPTDPGKIDVYEVFAYSCPHCFSFEPHVQDWAARNPKDVNFVRLPHTLGSPAGAIRNKAMYTADLLGQLEKFHRALFGAIHGQQKMMATVEEVRELFVKSTGVKAEEFDGNYGSFVVDSRFRIAEQAIKEMGITSVPAMVVDGRYVVSPRASGGAKEMLAITDWLVEQARKERGKSR